MNAKADHVRAATQARGHTCHWLGCAAAVPPAMWGCKKHWFILPATLRARIWAAYRIGQEDSQSPSREYVEVAREAQAWIAAYVVRQAADRVQRELW